jgi:hypothetical protein
MGQSQGICGNVARKAVRASLFIEPTATRIIHLDMLREWLMPQLQDDIPELIYQQDGAHRTSIMK